MVGDVAVTPLRFTGEFLTALAAADDQRAIADVLAAELYGRLGLSGVLVHEHVAGSRFERVGAAGHSTYFERPDVFNREVDAFLKEHRP